MTKVQVINNSGNPLPMYMTKGAAAVDLYANEVTELLPNNTAIIGTGLFLAIPEGYEVQIRSRSGLAAKNSILVLNSPGTIDSDYRGEIKVILHNLGKDVLDIRIGDRIAQAVLAPVVQIEWEGVEALDSTERGTGGLGSTKV